MLLYVLNKTNIQIDVTETIANYVSAKIVITENCCKTYTVDIADLTATVNTDDIYVSAASSFIVNPSAFAGATEIGDAIYTVSVTLTKANSDTWTDVGCIFYDVVTACLVNAKLPDLTKAGQVQLAMEHYTLLNGTNCDCKCDELCEIYKSLYLTLNSTEYDCGCV